MCYQIEQGALTAVTHVENDQVEAVLHQVQWDSKEQGGQNLVRMKFV